MFIPRCTVRYPHYPISRHQASKPQQKFFLSFYFRWIPDNLAMQIQTRTLVDITSLEKLFRAKCQQVKTCYSESVQATVLNDKSGREGVVEYVHAWIEPVNTERKSKATVTLKFRINLRNIRLRNCMQAIYESKIIEHLCGPTI
jgi:hypothetical protein